MNNVWIIGDEKEVIVIDASHDVETIAEGIADRRVVAVICTHGHNDHVNQGPALADRFDAPILLNLAEAPLWMMTHPDRKPDRELSDGDVFRVGGISLRAIVTPRSFSWLHLLVCRGPGHRLLRRHAVQGRARRDRTLILVIRLDH